MSLANLRLLRYAIIGGGIATTIGLLAAYYIRIPGLTTGWVWTLTTFALSLAAAWIGAGVAFRAERAAAAPQSAPGPSEPRNQPPKE